MEFGEQGLSLTRSEAHRITEAFCVVASLKAWGVRRKRHEPTSEERDEVTRAAGLTTPYRAENRIDQDTVLVSPENYAVISRAASLAVENRLRVIDGLSTPEEVTKHVIEDMVSARRTLDLIEEIDVKLEDFDY
jgi:hypothetical protein